ncbi:MAG: efflux RND transporter permease subunit, partial [Bdellovibrionales bacterium]|nr:efflux RND transporter permease subunit [Bdellovibrionales bacterium]
MTLSEICIKRPVLATMMNLVLVLIGGVAIFRLPVRELPDIDPPIISVQTVYPGANAQVVETEVTEKLEDVINGVEGIRTLTSESREEFSSITVEFNLARPIDIAAQDVRDRVSRIRSNLPDDIDDPVVAKQDSDARPMLWVAMYGDGYTTQQLTDIADRLLKDRLQTVGGVSSVIFGGEKRFAIRIRLDAKRMAAHGIAVTDIEDALKEQNVELPSGKIENLGREYVIRTLGEMKTPEEFNNLVLQRNGSTLTRLSDIGFAEAGVEDEHSIARYNSKPAVGIGVIKQSQANTVEVSRGIQDELERQKAALPEGIQVFVAYNESIFVEKAIDQVWSTLIVAFFLVVITIFVFLRNVRSTLVPTITIPVSLTATFLVLSMMGYSINILTLLGLVLAIGIVVDDSIIVLENIYHHIERGVPPMEAALRGMREITFAVIATTAVLVAVFLPLAFQTSITGQLFVEFAVALAGSVVISSFVALTLTPTVCARVLKVTSSHEESTGITGSLLRMFEHMLTWMETRYERSLQWVLHRRRTVMIFTGIALLLSGVLYTRLEREFLPLEDKGRLFSPLIAPEGATAQYTDAMLRKMEAIIQDVPEVAGFFSAVALPFNGPGRGSQGLAFVRFKEERSRRLQDIVGGPHGLGARFYGEIEGAFAIPIIPRSIGGGFSQPFQLVLEHPDIQKLNSVGSMIAGELRMLPYLTSVRPNFELNKPELEVRIDRDRAASLGVSIEAVSRTLQTLFGGRDLSTVKIGGKEYEVIAQLQAESRLTTADLDSVFVRSDSGKLIQLSS